MPKHRTCPMSSDALDMCWILLQDMQQPLFPVLRIQVPFVLRAYHEVHLLQTSSWPCLTEWSGETLSNLELLSPIPVGTAEPRCQHDIDCFFHSSTQVIDSIVRVTCFTRLTRYGYERPASRGYACPTLVGTLSCQTFKSQAGARRVFRVESLA